MDADQTQSKDDNLNTPEKKVHQNAVGTKITSNKVSINEEKLQPSLEKNKKPLNKNLAKDDSLKQVEVSSTPEKIIEGKASVLRTPSNRKLDVSDCLMKIRKRKKLQAMPKMPTQSEVGLNRSILYISNLLILFSWFYLLCIYTLCYSFYTF